MRILFVLPEYLRQSGGGIIAFYRALLPELVRHGHEVRVIVGSGVLAEAAAAPQTIEGVRVETLEYARLRKYVARFSRYSKTPWFRMHLAAAWAMWEQAEEGNGADLVETTDWGLLFVPWIAHHRLPVVLQLHGSLGQIDLHDPMKGREVDGLLCRLVENAGASLADELQAQSRFNADYWARGTGRPVECILPMWHLDSLNVGEAARDKEGLVVGRVQWWKGPDVLCKALRTFAAGDAPTIRWIGRDMAVGDAKTLATAFLQRDYPDIWGKNIIHTPRVSEVELRDYQRRAAFALVPSRWDTFNLGCVEAMSQGTPAICSLGAGVSELIEDGVNGFVFTENNGDALAAALEKFQSLDAARSKRMGIAGMEAIAEYLDPDKILPRRLERYEQVAQLGSRLEPVGSTDFLRQVCMPDTEERDAFSFLDDVPSREMVRNLLGRIHRRVWGQQR